MQSGEMMCIWAETMYKDKDSNNATRVGII